MVLFQSDFFLLLWMMLLLGFTIKRIHLILFLLNLEGFFFIYLWLLLFLGKKTIFFYSAISLLTMAVLEATVGLTILILMMRYFQHSNLKTLNHLKS